MEWGGGDTTGHHRGWRDVWTRVGLAASAWLQGITPCNSLTCFIPELPYPDELGLPAQPSCGVSLVCHNSNWVLKDVHKGS